MPALNYGGQRLPVGSGKRSSRAFFEVDKRDIERIHKKLERASGQPLHKQMERAQWAIADTVKSKIRAAAPKGRTGNLKKSIRARREKGGAWRRAGGGMIAAVVYGKTWSNAILVGPVHAIAPHRHLVISGTRERPSDKPEGSMRTRKGKKALILPSGDLRFTGTFTTGTMKANPFVDRGSRGIQRQAADRIAREWRYLLR